jgi:hypothetical protein
MRKLLVGLASLAAVAIATPASAQSIHFGFGGGHGHHHHGGWHGHHHHHPHHGGSFGLFVGAPAYYATPLYRDYDDDYVYVQRCRTVVVEDYDGYLRRVRRCG